MKSLPPMWITMGLAFVTTACVSYTGVSKSPNGELYISGATSYFVYSSPWVRRCEVDGTQLNCVELSEAPKGAAGAPGGTAPPASSAEPSTAAAPEATAPAPDSKSDPAKSKK